MILIEKQLLQEISTKDLLTIAGITAPEAVIKWAGNMLY